MTASTSLTEPELTRFFFVIVLLLLFSHTFGYLFHRFKLPRVIGWLYRWVRGYDLEESSTPAPLLYMRSPLLAGFNEPVGCPRDAEAREYQAPTCVAVTASDGHEHMATYLVPLQLGATTPAELAETLRQRLEQGDHVLLRIVGGGVVKLDPAKGKDISVQRCDPA